MSLWTTLLIAWRSIVGHGLRSFLTALGVVIGVASVIAMLALGAGTREKITATIRQYGANLLIVRPQQRSNASGVRSAVKWKSLSVDDAEAILAAVPEVEMVTPDLEDSFQAKYKNHNKNVSVSGEAPTYFTIRNFVIDRGRAITDTDVESVARVAVLGPNIAQDLFEDEDPVGKEMKIKGMNFVVIGVTHAKGNASGTSPDDNIWLPFTTAMRQVIGQRYLDQIYVRVRQGADLSVVQERVAEALRRTHVVQADAPDDFSIRNYQEAIDQLETVSKSFTLLLASIAAVSLLVGGINIMNVMLVTVTERTREIGVRKALGARHRDIMAQFLTEAISLSVLGGVTGILLGAGSIIGLNELTMRVSGEPYGAKIEAWPVLVSFGFAIAVGVFFGWYPAQKAARLDPIDALRYE